MKDLLGGVLAIIAIASLVVLSANLLTRASCESTATAIELPWSYSLMTGCIVTTKDGTKMPLDKYRSVE